MRFHFAIFCKFRRVSIKLLFIFLFYFLNFVSFGAPFIEVLFPHSTVLYIYIIRLKKKEEDEGEAIFAYLHEQV